LVFHVGLQKTGTTFIQRQVLAHWQGITYLPGDNLEYLLRAPDTGTSVISREGLSGRNWDPIEIRELSLLRLAKFFPDADIAISFRRHSDYIVSSYNQYIQRGGSLTFAEFFDPVHDRGLMKKKDFFYRPRITTLERAFGRHPFVFRFEEIREALPTLLTDLESFIGGKAPSREKVLASRNRKDRNPSVGYYPLQLLRFLNRYSASELNPSGRLPLNHYRIKRLGLAPRTICKYWLAFLPNRESIPPSLKSDIDALYAEDWAAILTAAADRRNSAGRPTTA
jgi:hypothetical protein